MGVLGSLGSPNFTNRLKELIVLISLEESGWTREQQGPLKESIHIACIKSGERKQEIVNLLCDLVVHPANYVRHCVVQILSGLVI